MASVLCIDAATRNLFSHAGVSRVWMEKARLSDVHAISRRCMRYAPVMRKAKVKTRRAFIYSQPARELVKRCLTIKPMKIRTRIGCLSMLVAAALNAGAQDIIVLKSGEKVTSKVEEINQTEVKYKKYSNLNGPLYVIDKTAVASITYENGDSDTFGDAPQPPAPAALEATETVSVPAAENEPMPVTEEAGTGEIETIPTVESEPMAISEEAKAEETAIIPAEETVAMPMAAATTATAAGPMTVKDNKAMVDSYNVPVSFAAKKQSKKAAKYVTWKYGVTENSVLSGEDIDISIELVWSQTCCQYGISIHNKTNSPIYIDRAKSFCDDGTGERRTYYSEDEVLTTILGTLKTSGDTLRAAAATRMSNRHILTIPPHGTDYLSMHDEEVTKKDNLLTFEQTKVLSHCENLYRDYGMEQGYIKVGETKTFTEQTTPARIGYTIYYDRDAAFQTAHTQTFGLYIQQAFGGATTYDISNFGGDYSQTWKTRQAKRADQLEKYVKQLTKIIPDYSPACIVGSHALPAGEE